VAGVVIETDADRAAEAVRAGVADEPDAGIDAAALLDLGRGLVAAAVVDDDELVRDALAAKARAERVERRADVRRFVARGDDDREQHRHAAAISRKIRSRSYSRSHRG